jgi:hypothetical protein
MELFYYSYEMAAGITNLITWQPGQLPLLQNNPTRVPLTPQNALALFDGPEKAVYVPWVIVEFASKE